jgi:hypothetical protein
MSDVANATLTLLALTACSNGWEPVSHVGEPASCERFTLHFAPLAASSFKHSGSFSRSISERSAPPRVQKGSFDESIDLRAVGAGYVATITPVHGDALTYQLDARGHRSPAEASSSRLDASWNALVGELNGLGGCVGDAHVQQAELKLTEGSVHYWHALRVNGFVDCAVGRCLQLERRENSDPYVLKGWLQAFPVKPALHRGKSRMQGHMTVSLDPSTLRLVSVEAGRVVTVVAGDGAEVTVSEEEQHSFTY